MTEKALALFGGNKIGLKDKKAAQDALRNSASMDPRGGAEGMEYLNFSGKLGSYSIGKDQEDVDKEERWLVNIYSFQNGWICWKGGRPVARRFASVFDAPVQTPDANEHGPFESAQDGWFQAKSFVLRSIDSGVQASFSINSKSGVSVFASLEDLISDRMANDEAEWPIITLDKEKFTAQGHVNYKPKFHVTGWLGDDQVAKLGELDEITPKAVNALLKEAGAGTPRKIENAAGFDDDEEEEEDKTFLRRRTKRAR